VAVAEQILERIAAGAGRHADDGPLGLPAAA
jgi:hypothetical protein